MYLFFPAHEAEDLEELKDGLQVEINVSFLLKRFPIILPDIRSNVPQGLRHN